MAEANADRIELAFTEEATFGTTPNAADVTATTISAAASDNSINDSGSGFGSFSAGQFILISGFAAANNNGYAQVLTAAAGKLTVRGLTLTDEAATPSVTIKTALKTLRLTGETLKQDTTTENSHEIRSDRQTVGVIRTGVTAGGDINYELSYAAYQEFLEAALFSNRWTDEVETLTADTGISAEAAGNQYVGGNGDFTGYTAGEFIRISGFTTAANNGYALISAINSSNPGTSDDDELVVAWLTLVDEAAGDPITITQGGKIENGTTQRFFSIEREYTDLTNIFAIYTGMEIESLSMALAPDNIITGAFTFMGKSEASAAATVGTGTNDDAETNSILNSIDNVDAILDNAISISASEFSIEIVNNLRGRLKIGELGAFSHGAGKIGVSGSITLYFENATMIDKYLNFTSSNLGIVLEDADGNAYLIYMPEVKFTDGNRNAAGENEDIMLTLPFQAFMDPTSEYTIRIARFDA